MVQQVTGQVVCGNHLQQQRHVAQRNRTIKVATYSLEAYQLLHKEPALMQMLEDLTVPLHIKESIQLPRQNSSPCLPGCLQTMMIGGSSKWRASAWACSSSS